MGNFTFNISLSVLNHLGRNLYRNFITVLGEAISNSWDADANNVWIYIDRENNHLIIKDDGEGMTSDDFQNKFLKIGYSKRKGGTDKTNSQRPFIGRKGIGKLALLSCAKRIHVLTKTKTTDFVGGVIDNSGLDNAINDDLTPQQYPLETVNISLFGNHLNGIEKGTIIYFEEINDGIRNRIEYIRKLIALFFRFSLIDKSFKISLNEEPITLNELNDLSQSTQFVWQINSIDDPYLKDKISISHDHIRRYEKLSSSMTIKGFIASVLEPKYLKIRNTQEKVTLDLYVNGRLREKDLLKHIPSARLVESYVYGQIHYDALDSETDRFTSSREGVIADDPLFQSLLSELKEKLMKKIIDDWDKWRVELRQDGDSENTTRMTKKERKSKELVNTITDEYVPPKSSTYRTKVDEWLENLTKDAEYNVTSYAECFVSENLLRNFINYKSVTITPEAKAVSDKMRSKELTNKNTANLSFDLRQSDDVLVYLDMDNLANMIEKVDPITQAGLSRDAKEYKPIRDAMAHTSLLTHNAKQRLNSTYENIKSRIKKLLE
ncbi:ATP-binding protein [Perlabentimonas gracilis]|uniref:ATP-binding protein n=1 Tax=Perlabentimonas gracilis TaxID=2715279 RepID=UPI00140BB3A5|nr:ATP-binding protein [Perlabentimonas gracilis]NHB70389.1 DNA mismatch repair protein [Perlabentimonas gracilis]